VLSFASTCFSLTVRNYQNEYRALQAPVFGAEHVDGLSGDLMQLMLDAQGSHPGVAMQHVPDMDRDIAITLAELLDDFNFVNAANKSGKSVCSCLSFWLLLVAFFIFLYSIFILFFYFLTCLFRNVRR
jgi:hypothetical protein